MSMEIAILRSDLTDLMGRVKRLEHVDNDRIASECRTTMALQQRIQALETGKQPATVYGADPNAYGGMGAPCASDSELHQSVNRLQTELLEARAAVERLHADCIVKDKQCDNLRSSYDTLRHNFMALSRTIETLKEDGYL